MYKKYRGNFPNLHLKNYHDKLVLLLLENAHDFHPNNQSRNGIEKAGDDGCERKMQAQNLWNSGKQ